VIDVERRAADGYQLFWSYGKGQNSSNGSVSSGSESFDIGSNHDGAGVGFVVNLNTERVLFVEANLHGLASSLALGVWGYANAEPMFHVAIVGLDPSTRELTDYWEVGIELRAVAPVFGAVELPTHPGQLSSATPNGSLSRVGTDPGRVFIGAGVKTYAGTGGAFAYAKSRIRAGVDLVRVVAW
jgi:hypothetical protein